MRMPGLEQCWNVNNDGMPINMQISAKRKNK